MANILVVTLTSNGLLDIDQSGGHHWIRATREPQEIFWVLSGRGLAHARFVSPRRKRKPGFDWPKGHPPAGVFGEPHLLADDRVLGLRVKHTGKPSEGWWKYVLRVTCCKDEFSSYYDDCLPEFELPPTTPCPDGKPCGPTRLRMVKNPIIINR